MAPDRKPEEAEEAEETAEIETEQEVEEVETEEAVEETETEEETEAEAEGEAEEEVEAEAPSRGSRQFGSLRAENRELRERLDRVERGQQTRTDPNAEQERQRKEREEEEQVILGGDVGKIAKFYSERASRESRAQITQVASHVLDRGDKADFRALCDENPALKAIAADVEKQLIISRSQNLNPSREALAKYMLGERMLSRAKGAKTRQERSAAQGRERQRAKPGGGRSDVPGNRRPRQDTQEARAKRLDDSGQL